MEEEPIDDEPIEDIGDEDSEVIGAEELLVAIGEAADEPLSELEEPHAARVIGMTSAAAARVSVERVFMNVPSVGPTVSPEV
ncbi:hypothetical protein [Branchiibius cervicis]|uniref:Uncharacterized protein n=1 Tax=Branchiibius cervicis TaxID=908252 RepID=A0ABW2AV37_9MICO